MANCVKTGGRVYFEDYGYTRNCDIHEIGDVYIVTSNPPKRSLAEEEDFSTFGRVNAQYGLRIGDGFTQNNCAIVVIDKSNLAKKE